MTQKKVNHQYQAVQFSWLSCFHNFIQTQSDFNKNLPLHKNTCLKMN